MTVAQNNVSEPVIGDRPTVHGLGFPLSKGAQISVNSSAVDPIGMGGSIQNFDRIDNYSGIGIDRSMFSTQLPSVVQLCLLMLTLTYMLYADHLGDSPSGCHNLVEMPLLCIFIFRQNMASTLALVDRFILHSGWSLCNSIY